MLRLNSYPEGIVLTDEETAMLDDFLHNLAPVELEYKIPLVIHYDERSDTRYVIAHIYADALVENSDLEATIGESEDDEIYKLNREITEDETAYKQMEEDAIKERSFEDIVIEYDTSYRENKPLKVYGGQHRITAITKAIEAGKNVAHGIRIYFNLSREQKVEIAIINSCYAVIG